MQIPAAVRLRRWLGRLKWTALGVEVTLFALGAALSRRSNEGLVGSTLDLGTLGLCAANSSKMASAGSAWTQIPSIIVLVDCSIVTANGLQFCGWWTSETAAIGILILHLRRTFEYWTCDSAANARAIGADAGRTGICVKLLLVRVESLTEDALAGKLSNLPTFSTSWATFTRKFDLFGNRTLKNRTSLLHAR